MSDYTPTTEEVREVLAYGDYDAQTDDVREDYVNSNTNDDVGWMTSEIAQVRFDRWYAAEIAKAEQRGYNRGFTDGWNASHSEHLGESND